MIRLKKDLRIAGGKTAHAGFEEPRYMKFAKWLFAIAGIYGLLVVAPLYWREEQITHDYPPAITHPEYF